VNPEQFGLLLSVFFLSAVIVGGMGSVLGAVLGAVFMTLLPEVLREGALLVGATLNLDVASILVPLRETIFGLLMVAFLILEPRGLAQLWKRAVQRFSRGGRARERLSPS
jgi:branched-chain amino acid transport system permease protein